MGPLTRIAFAVLLALLPGPEPALAEDGYDLWLRYRPLPAAVQPVVDGQTRRILLDTRDPRAAAGADELARAVTALTGRAPDRAGPPAPGTILIGTPAQSARIRALGFDLAGLGAEGYLVRHAAIDGAPVIVVAAQSGAGLLYGSFALIDALQQGGLGAGAALRDRPAIGLRVLNHWDNLDRSVERGYAGQSIWDWWRLPGHVDGRITDYGRANASIGVNGTVLNNVNASADSLTAPYLAKAAAIADTLRPWGMKVYLSARFSAPVEIGGLATADPLDPRVRRWWRDKAKEVYARIPDFGGFLVKANSEGQPGPRDYGRSHAEGANMLAEALAPHGGVVMWRAFVYTETDPEDRAKQAYSEFRPLDGRFASNVLVQVKNGPIDFQPREPFHPLFGAMPATPLMLELQITKEYLGFATHLVYLGPLFGEVLAADTGHGGSVAEVIDGTLHGQRLTGIAGVANIGSDRDWSGSHFDQANWFAFGRLAWNPRADVRAVAERWLALTWTRDPEFVSGAADMMMGSRQAAVDYMTPLGLAHQMATDHHYGPGPWVSDLPRPEWNPTYYARADADGIGFDRTATGSNAIAQYAPGVAARFAEADRVGDDLLLWFHHLPWDHRLANGDTLWHGLVRRYNRGVASVGAMRAAWDRLAPFVDGERARQTRDFLAIQAAEARWWRDASVAWFQSIARRPLPPGSPPPAHDLNWYRQQSFPHAPGH